MTPGARVQAAIELLDVIRAGTPAEQAITGWARRSRFAGSKDRAAIRDLVFQAVRCLRSYACLGGATTGRGVMIGALRAEGTDPSDVFTGAGYAPHPLDPHETTAGHAPTSVGDTWDVPDWIIPRLIKSLGGEDHAKKTALVLKDRAPVTLRVNTRKSTKEAVMSVLAQAGIETEPLDIASTALRVISGARKVAQSEAYLDGLVELQDGASQAAMAELTIPPGARVLDYCAGGGGKVLALAARHDARWFAHDALSHRMVDLPPRAARAGARIDIVETPETSPNPFDLVLCDVPCSGSGTWRRTPDAKWRFTEEDLLELIKTQDGILDRACDLVGPSGVLAYATCSVLSDENEDRVADFVTRHPEWTVSTMRRWTITKEGDGFFLAQLKRDGAKTAQS